MGFLIALNAAIVLHPQIPQPLMENESDKICAIPPLTLRRKLNSDVTDPIGFSINLRDVLQLLPLGIRVYHHCYNEKANGREPFMDFTVKRAITGDQGAPLGGIGAGSIGRSFKGGFQNFKLYPLKWEEKPIISNQFSAFVTRPDGRTFSTVLCSNRPDFKKNDSGVKSWDWNLNGEKCTYHTLYPRSWTVYDGVPDPDLKITCRQISPIIPNNYEQSSFPVAVFSFAVTNTGSTDANVSLLFTWTNSIGGDSGFSGNHFNRPVNVDGIRGVTLHHRTVKGPPLTYAIAAVGDSDTRVSVCPTFAVAGSSPGVSAKQMWDEIKNSGTLDNLNSSESVSEKGSSIGASVAASVSVPPGSTRVASFSLSWDCPEVHFGSHVYHRRYTKYYNTLGNSAAKIARDALFEHSKWEELIEQWQKPILENRRYPEWYAVTLFNELYYLNAGGTVWTDGSAPTSVFEKKFTLVRENGYASEKETMINVLETIASTYERVGMRSTSAAMGTRLLMSEADNVGQFLYLEGIEYLMWNTYDVHFYASFALAMLFPKLELSIQRDFAAAVLVHDTSSTHALSDGTRMHRKVLGAVPHDFGFDNPWFELNAYNFFDTSRWKDLNPKFVLQVYRDYIATRDSAFVNSTWPSVYLAMAFMDQFDKDGDGMIENENFPDQTYDAWPVRGVSAYCGGLYVAALQATSALARVVGDSDCAGYFWYKYVKAKKMYGKLWNGEYFSYDSSGNKTIHADQLAGEWYARACGMQPIAEDERIKSALGCVYKNNVGKTRGGTRGAVNGMVDGKADMGAMQGYEVWPGVTYALSAAMIQEGMEEEGFCTARGVYDTAWAEDGLGYAFQVPESWNVYDKYRSICYMRPLAIWAMEWALTRSDMSVELGPDDGFVVGSERYLRQHEGFTKVAELLRLPDGNSGKSIIQRLYEFTCQRYL